MQFWHDNQGNVRKSKNPIINLQLQVDNQIIVDNLQLQVDNLNSILMYLSMNLTTFKDGNWKILLCMVNGGVEKEVDWTLVYIH